jgi:CheY-like chemotaxis protein
MMERQVSHMVRLVEDLMEVSRITRGKIELRREQIELAAVVRSAVETSKPLIEAGRHQLAISLPTEPLILNVDPVRTAQILGNLLNNAAKYMDEGGQVWLTARREGNEAVISVRDASVGISAEMLPRAFEMFTQVDRTAARAQGGLGIGLALVRSLVQMHGGRVEAHSDGPGRGSEFIVHLPLASHRGPTGAAPKKGGQENTGLSSRRILVVDDNHDAADSLGLLLKFLGADAQVVYDGPGALEAIRTYRPAVVLLDIGMPGMKGYEVARQVRQEPDFRDIVLVALTGWGQDEDRLRSKAAGFDHHLVKPVAPDALQALLVSLEGTLADP